MLNFRRDLSASSQFSINFYKIDYVLFKILVFLHSNMNAFFSDLFLVNDAEDFSILLEQIYNIRRQEREIICVCVCVKEGKLHHFQTILATLAFTLSETRRQWRLRNRHYQVHSSCFLVDWGDSNGENRNIVRRI